MQWNDRTSETLGTSRGSCVTTEEAVTDGETKQTACSLHNVISATHQHFKSVRLLQCLCQEWLFMQVVATYLMEWNRLLRHQRHQKDPVWLEEEVVDGDTNHTAIFPSKGLLHTYT